MIEQVFDHLAGIGPSRFGPQEPPGSRRSTWAGPSSALHGGDVVEVRERPERAVQDVRGQDATVGSGTSTQALEPDITGTW